MTDILQSAIPYDVTDQRRLPGILPMPPEEWLIRDDAFAGQMGRRDQLLRDRHDAVVAMDESARPAALELLEMVLATAYPDAGEVVERPDGVRVPIDRTDPMTTLGHLVQEDFCILEKPEGAEEHVLTAAVLCFPASWTLAEKFMQPLIRIHVPVPEYDANIAARVQRLFDGVQVGRPIWRFNALWYDDAELHQPRLEAEKRPHRRAAAVKFLRSERQSLLRLPESRAVVFSIHTFVMAGADAPGGAERLASVDP